MLRYGGKQLSFYSGLYEKIPKNHLLKRIAGAVDFSFINEMLAEKYCADFGRPAKEPELMTKLLFLEQLYTLSDVRVIEESSYNLAHLWFLGLNPEDELPDPSLLAKFRTQRLEETELDDIMTEIVRQCVEKGIIKGEGLSVDTTHSEANTTKKVPERLMKYLAKRIFKGLEADTQGVPETVNTDIPDYKQIEDHKEAKKVMKEYLEEVIDRAAPLAGPETQSAIEEAQEILGDEKFIQQRGVRSLADKDARVGSKSKTSQFFGYKTEFAMTTDERIITAMSVHSGEYVDGKDFNALMDRTLESGMTVKEVYGDKAYFRKDILEKIEKMQAESYIPVSASVYKIDEELFAYNKDSDQWFCFMGNFTISKKRIHRKEPGKQDVDRYVFDKEQCIDCPYRERCMGKSKTKARRLQVALTAPIFYEHSQRQKQPEFLEKYKKRSAHEWKNGELKRFHGMDRARGWGLRSMTFQAKLTAIAVNLKRIAAIAEENARKTAAGAAENARQAISFFVFLAGQCRIGQNSIFKILPNPIFA